uniref:Ig-like domain-containing protein n=1 Tax=Dicentrarchus labrax TaxID=13489 RepID=A0A8P4FWD2_DICLA
EITAFFLLAVAHSYSTLAQRDNVLQPKGDVTATEGEEVTLDCQYNSRDEGNIADEFKKRFSSTLDSTSRSVPLKIQKLQLSDSAVYYCALSELKLVSVLRK